MASVTESITMRQPVAVVFPFVSTYTNDPLWRAGVLEMHQAPSSTQVGTTTREVMDFFGRRLITDAEITAFTANDHVGFESRSGPMRVVGYRRVEPVDAGTRVTYHVTATLTGLFRAAAPLVVWSFRRKVRQDLQRLRDLLEQTGQPGR